VVVSITAETPTGKRKELRKSVIRNRFVAFGLILIPLIESQVHGREKTL
jgi:hypothetical protein